MYRRILGPVYDNEKENWRILTLWHTTFITHGAPTNTNFLGENGNLIHLYFIHAKLIFKRAFYRFSNGIRHVMPSTDRSLELKAKNSDGLDRLTAGCVCQWVNTLRTGSFKLFKRPFPRFLTILTL